MQTANATQETGRERGRGERGAIKMQLVQGWEKGAADGHPELTLRNHNKS